MKKNKVNVLVTFYNQEQYVDKALQSIFNQKTDFEFSVIVGDDGSSDGTCDKVKRWIEQFPGRIEFHIMSREQDEEQIPGFRASRNRLNLLKHVNSEYFNYLDGDDYFIDDKKLQKQVDILDKTENSDCIACAHGMQMLFDNGECRTMVDNTLKEGKYSPKDYWYGMYFHTDSLLIRSKVIADIPTKLLENNFNDNLITYSVIQNGNLYYLPEIMGIYFQTGDGIWTSGNQIVNVIRNVFLYDLANMINPQMKRETDHRMRVIWHELLCLRTQINDTELTDYANEAEDKDLKMSKKWIHYKKLETKERLSLLVFAISRSIRIMIRNELKDIYHLFTRVACK